MCFHLEAGIVLKSRSQKIILDVRVCQAVLCLDEGSCFRTGTTGDHVSDLLGRLHYSVIGWVHSWWRR